MILVEADASGEWDGEADWPELAAAAARAAVAASAWRALLDVRARIEISVRFGTDQEVRRLNAAWRGKDEATNVLSFPMVDPDQLDGLAASGEGEHLLGDVVLARGVCVAEAREKAVSLPHHASHLVVHGTLHLLGHDHETGERDAAAMEALEREALAALGIADPYLSEVRS